MFTQQKKNMLLSKLLVVSVILISCKVQSVEIPSNPINSYYFPGGIGESATTDTFSTTNIIEAKHAVWDLDDNWRIYWHDKGEIILNRLNFYAAVNYSSYSYILDIFRGKYDDNGVTKYAIDETYNGDVVYDGISIDEVVGKHFDPYESGTYNASATTRLNMFIDALAAFRLMYPDKIILVYSATPWQDNIANYSTLIDALEEYADLIVEEIYIPESDSLNDNWTYPKISTRMAGMAALGSSRLFEKTSIILGSYQKMFDRSDVDDADHLAGQLEYIKNDSFLSQIKGIGLYSPQRTYPDVLAKINKSVMDNILCCLYLRLDENSGSCAADVSSFNNNGNLINFSSPNWCIGKSANALEFDGVDDYINCNNDSSLESNEFTYALWIYPTTVSPAYQELIGKNSIWNKGFFLSGSDLRGFVAQSLTNSHDRRYGVIQQNQWQHVAMTYKNNEIKLYLNGQRLTGTSSTTIGDGAVTSTLNNNLFISEAGYTFNGFMDDIRVYASALSANDISNIYNDAPLQLRFRLDEQLSSSKAKDSSGLGNIGTLTNFDTLNCWVSGVSGNALEFDGVDDYIDCGSDSSLDLKKFTYMAWIKPRTISTGYQHIFGRESIWRRGLFMNYGNLRGYVNQQILSTTAKKFNIITANVWQHVAMTYEDNDIKLYLNGQELSLSAEQNGSGNLNDESMYNMCISGPENRFDGLMDDIRIYSRVLSQNDIDEIYQQGITNALDLLQMHLKLNESSNAITAIDDALSNDGTLTNFDTSSCWVSGVSGNALEFDGVDDYIDCGSDLSLDPEEFTYAVWIYPYSLDAEYQQLIGKSGIWTQSLFISNNDLRGFVDQSISNSSNRRFDVLTENTWQHVVMTYKNNEIKLYLNSQLLTGPSIFNIGDGAVVSTVDNNLNISSLAYPFYGIMDDVRIYLRALSDAEVYALFSE